MTIISFLATLLFRASLDLTYILAISPEFEHGGFDMQLNSNKLVESYIFLILVFLIIPKKSSKFSHLASQLLFIFSYVPMGTVYCMTDSSREWFYLGTIFWTTLSLAVRFWRPISISYFAPNKSFLYASSAASFCVLFMTLLYKGNLNLSFSLREVYSVRESFYAGDSVSSLSVYALGWIAKVLVPLAIFWALTQKGKRRWLFIAAACSVNILLFAIVGEKNFIFRLPFVFMIAWILRKKSFLTWLSLFGILIAVTSTSYYLLTTDSWLVSLFPRRLWMIPAQLSFYYHDFFDGKPLFLSGSRLNGLFADYPYPLSPAQLIGLYYFGSADISANNGILTEGFINFSSLGVPLWALLIAAFLKLGDSISKDRHPLIAHGLLLVSIISFFDTFFLTSLLTHGCALAYALVYFVLKKRSKYMAIDTPTRYGSIEQQNDRSRLQRLARKLHERVVRSGEIV